MPRLGDRTKSIRAGEDEGDDVDDDVKTRAS